MGIVYIIECLETGEKYIGSTMRSLEDRYKDHRYRYNCSSRRIIDRGNHTARALEVVDTQDRDQLRIREQYWINRYECVNQTRAYRTEEERKAASAKFAKEFKERNPDDNKNRVRRYRERHPEKMNQMRQNWIKNNPEKHREMNNRYACRKREWEASWKSDWFMYYSNRLLDIDPKLFD